MLIMDENNQNLRSFSRPLKFWTTPMKLLSSFQERTFAPFKPSRNQKAPEELFGQSGSSNEISNHSCRDYIQTYDALSPIIQS